jgi:hypothetical protein
MVRSEKKQGSQRIYINMYVIYFILLVYMYITGTIYCDSTHYRYLITFHSKRFFLAPAAAIGGEAKILAASNGWKPAGWGAVSWKPAS